MTRLKPRNLSTVGTPPLYSPKHLRYPKHSQPSQEHPCALSPSLASFRAAYPHAPAARRPPFVLIGATFASDYYWHGTIMTQYARDWVRLYTQGKGTFTTTEMEDAGFMNAIERLGNMHRVDPNRVLVLRTGSNFSEERPGHAAAESITAPYIGGRLALESAYLC